MDVTHPQTKRPVTSMLKHTAEPGSRLCVVHVPEEEGKVPELLPETPREKKVKSSS